MKLDPTTPIHWLFLIMTEPTQSDLLEICWDIACEKDLVVHRKSKFRDVYVPFYNHIGRQKFVCIDFSPACRVWIVEDDFFYNFP